MMIKNILLFIVLLNLFIWNTYGTITLTEKTTSVVNDKNIRINRNLNVYDFKDEENHFQRNFWRMRNLGSSHENLKESIGDHLEVTYHLINGDVTYIFDKKSNSEGKVEIIADNVLIEEEDIETIKNELKEAYKEISSFSNKRVDYGIKLLEYLSTALPGYILKSRVVPFVVERISNEESRRILKKKKTKKPTNLSTTSSPTKKPVTVIPIPTREPTTLSPTNKPLTIIPKPTFPPVLFPGIILTSKPTNKPTTKSPTFKCGDEFLSTWATIPHSGVGCPVYSQNPSIDDGTRCICPYSGKTPRTAVYDGKRKDGLLKSVAWTVKYGLSTDDCVGRCGPGCNRLDNEAFQDCLEHDVCVEHFGGSSFRDNPQCYNEFDAGIDDTLASLGFFCC